MLIINMFTCASTKPPRIPMKTPNFVRKTRRGQKQRDQQLKTLVNDISNIATQEIDRLKDIVHELLDNPTENPIIIEKEYEQESNDE